MSPERTNIRENPQAALFDVEPNWREYWWGMPSYEMKDARPSFRIVVNFVTWDDVREFGKVLGLSVTPRTDSVWYPPDNAAKAGEWVYE